MNTSAVLLILHAVQAGTQNPAPGHTNGRTTPDVSAALVELSPELDGHLDDPAWQLAAPVSEFTQVIPEDGTAPTERTEVRVVYDGSALYIGARLYDRDPSAIERRLGRRDSHMSSDRFTVSLDSYHDHRTTFQFTTNPAGVRSDAILTNDNAHGDGSWDPVWEVATSIDDDGWVVEMRIPFSQIRFASGSDMVWGINFSRFIFRKNESVRWSWAPNTEQGYASLFGHLRGLRDIPQPRGLEILPYTVAQSDFQQGADPANPFNDGSVQNLSGGLDLKYGVTSDLTLDASINPDFGQVEADPAVVNLTAFETFFSERRPFFVEGANIFQFGAGSGSFIFGAPQLFYSRRIGRQPSVPASAGQGYADNPTATSIMGAVKLSGKTAGWSIGLLDAVTNRETARLQSADGTRTTEPVEPLANYGVLSLRKDLRGGSTGVGVLATTLNRRLNDPRFDGLRSAAYAGGVDFFHRFADNQFTISGTFSGSHIRGSTDAMLSAQRSSARYFQRPDQDYVSVDSNATSMTGYAVSFQAGKTSGNWLYGMDFFAYSPRFEVNDAGFQTETDRIFHGIRVTRRWLTPGTVFRNFRISSTWSQDWNFGGTRGFAALFLGGGGQFRNYWNFNVGMSYNFGGQSDKATRGGPLMEAPRQWSANAFLSTDSRKAVSLGAFGFYARNVYGGFGGGGGGSINIRPTGAMTISLQPSYNYTHSMGFYVTQRSDPLATATFGGRYVFSELVQNTLNLTLRMDMAITPDLTIQLWAQPFVASGDYQRFKELAEPSTFNFLRYGRDGNSTIALDPSTSVYTADPDGPGPADPIVFANPDFRFRSLRSNLVVRWEYLPGSTLFIVWNHGRSGFAADPTFDVLDELGNLFRDDMQNTLLIKLNYWIMM